MIVTALAITFGVIALVNALIIARLVIIYRRENRQVSKVT